MANDSYTIQSDPFAPEQPRLPGLTSTRAVGLAGTFADSRHAPIHRWYPMVVGFSYASIIKAIRDAELTRDAVVLDPFLGSGTTVVTAKALGIQSLGVEAHPLLAMISRAKTCWRLRRRGSELRELAEAARSSGLSTDALAEAENAPDFLHKLFPETESLARLISIRHVVEEYSGGNAEMREFMLLALMRAAYLSTRSKVDGVYIAPDTLAAKALHPQEAFATQVSLMISDLAKVPENCLDCAATVVEGDARTLTDIEEESIDLVFTSPPYLNNFDYAEMTRMELYLLGIASSWADITRVVRSRLVRNATTQVSRREHGEVEPVREMPPGPAHGIRKLSDELAEKRLQRSGRKDYDITVITYFNDMTQSLSELARVLRPGALCVLTVGDSGLYGTHIPTDVVLRDIGLGVGFSRSEIAVLRRRGYRWQLPRRESIPLRESQVRLWK